MLRLTAMHRLIEIAFAIELMTVSPAMLVADEINDAAIDGAGFATPISLVSML